ncbi:hypothetical protein U27_02023 [Candidatus Vecturithrix granuli]|uniref:Uncharacterized protein n=1 Tax=Vecturithrix granuli TaxID=1499967 RepID=A0A0S6W6F9_VECG1|nr:hypothetical protein U27_02023 [Candidatus Vecturithrix granuli]
MFVVLPSGSPLKRELRTPVHHENFSFKGVNMSLCSLGTMKISERCTAKLHFRGREAGASRYIFIGVIHSFWQTHHGE